MTPDQIARVRASWALIVPVAETVAARCYERLFALHPSLRALFARVDLVSQQRKLVQTLGMVVAGIDDLSSLLPALETLGQRHAAYGVTPAHYEALGDALLWAIDRALGDVFDGSTRQAWAAAYDLLATTMVARAGGHGPERPRAPAHEAADVGWPPR
jgi:hemoglobin-like flavoprotein